MHTNTKDLNPKGDGSYDADTTTTTDASDRQHQVDGSQTSQSKPNISEARVRANRANAKKSTGPKTARGKAHSSRNAITHGLLIKQLLFSEEGKPQNEELQQLYDGLCEKYGTDDIRTHLLAEGLVVDYWRQRQALVLEKLSFTSGSFSSQGVMPNLQRYRSASQRTLLKHLELLDELPLPQSDGDEEGAEDETPTPQPEDPPAVLESPSGLTVVAAEQGTTACGSQSEIEATSGEDSAPTGEREEAA